MKSLCNRRQGGPGESAGRSRRRKEAAPPAAGCRLWPQALLLAALLAVALFALAGCQETDPRAMREGSGHFERQDALPELSDETSARSDETAEEISDEVPEMTDDEKIN